MTVSASGDYGASTGQRTVTIPTTGSVTFTVGTTDDSTDETDGSVTATVNAGSAYTVSSTQGAATVSVSDNDDAPGKTVLAACQGDPELLINSPAASRSDASVDFTVSLSCIPSSNPTILLTPVRDGNIGNNIFISLTAEEPSTTVTVTIGSENELGLALAWNRGLANDQAQGNVVFTD